MRTLILCALWLLACAPSQSLRPAHALGERDHELGLAVSRIGPRPFVIEPARQVAQGWWSTKLGEHWATSALVAFDTSGVLAGSALRVDLWRGSSFAAASEIELGFLWAAASLPLSLRVYGDAWLYASPRIGHWGPHFAPFFQLKEQR
jgi:hypothetical protein